MGFRSGAYCTVWEVETVSDTMTKARISNSRKNRNSGEYEQEFGGYVAFVGTAAARKAAALKERDRIRLGDVDVTTKYDKARNTTYTNFKIFSFEAPEEIDGGGPAGSTDIDPSFNEIPDGVTDDMMPF